MRRALASDHEAAVARRLELLSAELATVRGESPRPRLRVAGPVEAAEEEAADADVDVDAAELGVEHWRPGGVTRVRAPGPGEPSPPPAPVLPRLPGRHASRRPLPWGSLVPEPLHGRWSLGPGQVAVLAVGAAVGLALTCWWLVRSGGHDAPVPAALPAAASALVTPSGVGDPAATPAVDVSAGPAVPGGAGPGAGPRIVVDVTGRVRRPGIVVLRSGSRVIDALRAAGGARRRTPLASLNLARVLTDGEQIVVGSPQPAVASGVVPSPSGSPVVGLVDLNTADETALESLPEVGPVTAQAILAWRTEHGGFTAVSQLLDVDGIGDATLAKLTPYVTI
jgi:competence protein ComEA